MSTGTDSGRVALVTGGARGIGLACVQALTARGDRVAFTYLNSPPPDLTGSTLAIHADVRSSKDVDAAFVEVEECWGPVQVLVANAGITRDKLVLRMSEDDWADVLDVDLTGAWRSAKRAASAMVRAHGGRIVFVGSVIGSMGGAGQANYGAAKAGLIGLARSLARELASRQVTVNVVVPGAVDTDLLRAAGEHRLGELAGMVPLGRLATTDEVAAAVDFLAGPAASYVTGAVLAVDGGLGMGH